MILLLSVSPHEYKLNKDSTCCVLHSLLYSHHLRRFLAQRIFANQTWISSNISWKQIRGPNLTQPTLSHDNPPLEWVDTSTCTSLCVAAKLSDTWMASGHLSWNLKGLPCKESDYILTWCLKLLGPIRQEGPFTTLWVGRNDFLVSELKVNLR